MSGLTSTAGSGRRGPTIAGQPGAWAAAQISDGGHGRQEPASRSEPSTQDIESGEGVEPNYEITRWFSVNARQDRDESAISVVSIDGQDVVRAGIEAWATGSEPAVTIAGSYSSPAEFISDYPTATPEIDVVVLELQYESQGPQFEILQKLCSAGHRVIVYSHLVSEEVILTSLDAGAISYVVKWEGGKHLREAIYSACTDEPYVAPRMAKALATDATVGRPRLSEREREVLLTWFQTENKDAVAQRLFIEPSTVATHLQRVRAKYAAVGRPAPTKAALVARAIHNGLLSPEDL